MATVRELITRIVFKSDTKAADAAIVSVKQSLTSVITVAGRAGGASGSALAQGAAQGARSFTSAAATISRAMSNASSSAARSMQTIAASARQAGGAIRAASESANMLAVTFAGALTTGNIKATADEMMSLDGRLRSVVSSDKERYELEDKLYNMAVEDRSSFAASGDLFYGVAQGTKEMGASLDDVIRFTQIVQRSLVAGGAGAQQAASVALQLTQGIQSGVLQGDELHSLRENAPDLVRDMLESMGYTMADVKTLSEEGALTTDVVFENVLKAGAKVDERFKKMPVTMGQAMQNATNVWDKFIMGVERDKGVFSTIGSAMNDAFVDASEGVETFFTLSKGSGGDEGKTLKLAALAEQHPVIATLVEDLRELGRMLEEAKNKAVELGTQLNEKLGGIDPTFLGHLATAAVIFGAIIAVIIPIGAAFALVGAAISGISVLFAALGAIAGAVMSAIGALFSPVTLAILAVVAAIKFAMEHMELLEAVCSPALELIEGGVKSLQEAWANLQPFIAAIMPLVSFLAELVGGLLVGAVVILFQVASSIFAGIASLIEMVTGLMKGLGEIIQWCADQLVSFLNWVDSGIKKVQSFLGLSTQVGGMGGGADAAIASVVGSWGGGGTQTNNYTFNTHSLAETRTTYRDTLDLHPTLFD